MAGSTLQPSSSSEFSIRDAREDDSEVLADFAVAMAKETEGKALDRETVLRGIRLGIADPSKGASYLVAESPHCHPPKLIGTLMLTSEWSDWHCAAYWVGAISVRATRAPWPWSLLAALPGGPCSGKGKRGGCGEALCEPEELQGNGGVRGIGDEGRGVHRLRAHPAISGQVMLLGRAERSSQR
eukprot:RCo034958